MPAGLDGHPEPIVTAARSAVVDHVAAIVRTRARRANRMMIVGIDGHDGAGKSTFGDELAAALAISGVAVVRASIDSFHRPRAERWAKGRASPEGFYRDSHDLGALRDLLIQPIRQHRPFVTALFDEPSDSHLPLVRRAPDVGGVVVFDGIFLHRPELADAWDLSVWLDGAERVAALRSARAIEGCPHDPYRALLHLASWWTRLDRYVTGQRLYVDTVAPHRCADVAVDNNDLASPRVISVDPLVPRATTPSPRLPRTAR